MRTILIADHAAPTMFVHALALDICSTCPVRPDCLEDALRMDPGTWAVFGVRGGMAASERRAMMTG
jgi:hypothetical protein